MKIVPYMLENVKFCHQNCTWYNMPKYFKRKKASFSPSPLNCFVTQGKKINKSKSLTRK